MKTPDGLKIVRMAGEYLQAPYLPDGATADFVFDIVERYQEPWRYYHTSTHLVDMVGFLVENASQLHCPRSTLWAALGHDEVYIPQAPPGVNEELSAQQSRARLVGRLGDYDLRRIGKFIRATADHQLHGGGKDLAFMLDADLKILGAPAEEFDQYDANIELEYSFKVPAKIPRRIYRQKRREVLAGILARDRIFMTDIAYDQFEAPARENLERKIDELAA